MEFHSDNANYKTDINLNFLENYTGNRNSVWSESDNIKIISDFIKEVNNQSKGLENSLSSDAIVLQETYNDILLYINSDIENEIDIFISSLDSDSHNQNTIQNFLDNLSKKANEADNELMDRFKSKRVS